MKNEIKDWNWFKELVKRLRKQQDALMREQGGSNHVMLALSLIAYDLDDWVNLNPHSINLHTKMTHAYVNGVYQEIDVKYLFLMERLKPHEEA